MNVKNFNTINFNRRVKPAILSHTDFSLNVEHVLKSYPLKSMGCKSVLTWKGSCLLNQKILIFQMNILISLKIAIKCVKGLDFELA